jgi:hypothetical protein
MGADGADCGIGAIGRCTEFGLPPRHELEIGATACLPLSRRREGSESKNSAVKQPRQRFRSERKDALDVAVNE